MFVFFKLKSVIQLFSLLYGRFFVGIHKDVLNLLLYQKELSDIYFLNTFSSVFLFLGTLSNVCLDSLPEAIVVHIVN